jgi:hypothetical protein
MVKRAARITHVVLGISLALTLAVSAEAGHGASHRPAPALTSRPAHRPVVVPPFPQYYIKAHDGSAIPVVPIFVVPVAPAPAPVPVTKPSCYRFFCD